MLKITAIVMAAGMSRRMMADKLQMKINNKQIYEYVLETIKNYNFYETIVVAKNDAILAKAKDLGFLGVKNTNNFRGKSESIKVALKASKSTNGFIFFVADQPFISLSTIKKLCSTFYDNPDNIILPYYNGIQGNPVIFPAHLKEQLLILEKDQGGKTVISKNRNKVIGVDILTSNEFMDIDTLEDFEKAIKENIIG